MKSASRFAVPAMAAILALPGWAETVVQPASFETSNEDNLYQGDGSQQLATSGFFTSTVQPFDASLGTLISFSLRCEITGDLSGTVGDSQASGSASGGLGGTFKIGGLAFDGTGGSNGTGGAAGDPLAAQFGIPTYDRTLLVSDAGVTYAPDILATVTGDQPFEITYDSAVTVNHSNVIDLLASVNGSLVLTYTYETATGGTATLKMVGIIRNAENGQVTIEWVSSDDKTYAVEAGDGLAADDWETIAPSVPGSAGTTTYTESVPMDIKARFYRVREND